MWLLSAARAELEYFNDPEDVPHPGICILSHTWGKMKDEQTFQEVNAIRKDCEATGANPRDHVSDKIRKCCELAEQHGYKWVWIDTCCINKESSSELSEAINSMFRYYSLSSVCYAYLADISPSCDPLIPDTAHNSRVDYDYQNPLLFSTSRWHRRGWTLQELIAPQSLLFFSKSWTFLGTKADLAGPLEQATRVPIALLRRDTELSSFSIAQRMSWAASRETSRKEDRAYCLLGIFDINMPTLYGEGNNAFYRLQEEIIRKSPDTTVFAWELDYVDQSSLKRIGHTGHLPLLAGSSRGFKDCGGITSGPGSVLDLPKAVHENNLYNDLMSFTLTPHGVLAHVPSALFKGIRLIDLNWHRRFHNQTVPVRIYLALALSKNDEDGQTLWCIPDTRSSRGCRCALYSKDPIEADWKMQDLYILARENGPRNRPGTLFPCNASAKSAFHFRISPWGGLPVNESFNVNIDQAEGAPAVLQIAARFYLTFGVCTLHAREDAPELVTHWITAGFCPYVYSNCDSCQNNPSHSCQDDHIGSEESWKNYSVDATWGWESMSNADRLTYSFKLHLRRHPWAKNTVIVEEISELDMTHQLSSKRPLTYALDPTTNRVLLHTDGSFPTTIAGPPISEDDKGSEYLGSAVLEFGDFISPCRIVLQDETVKVFIMSENEESQHYGYYYLLAFDEKRMHWIPWNASEPPAAASAYPRARPSRAMNRRPNQALTERSVWEQCPVLGGWFGGVKMMHARIDKRHGKKEHWLGAFCTEDGNGSVACDGKVTTVTSFDILCWKKDQQIVPPSKPFREIGHFAYDRSEEYEESSCASHEICSSSESSGAGSTDGECAG